MNANIIGVYEDATQAKNAIPRLMQAGYERDQLELLMSLETRSRQLGYAKPLRTAPELIARYAGLSAMGAFVVLGAVFAATTLVMPRPPAPHVLLVSLVAGLGVASLLGGMAGLFVAADRKKPDIAELPDIERGRVGLKLEVPSHGLVEARRCLGETGASEIRALA
jgi:hypothetical protein